MRRAPRRILVVASALLMGVAVAVSAASPSLFLTLLVVATLLGMRFSLATRRLTERSVASLDEREVELRDRVYFRAYKLVMLVGVVSVVALMAMWLLPPLEAGDRIVSFMLVFYVWLVMYLPSALLAWQLPDPHDDDLPLPA